LPLERENAKVKRMDFDLARSGRGVLTSVTDGAVRSLIGWLPIMSGASRKSVPLSDRATLSPTA